jgi:dCMP deaminase
MNWHEYNMEIAHKVAQKSKDPATKVGCVIVDEKNHPVSWGFNGMVQGADESFFSWERPHKYFTVIHAEMNAVLFAERRLEKCTVYVTHGPCEACLKHLLQAGARKIIYSDPSILVKRGTLDQKQAIKSLIFATGADVFNINNLMPYETELWEGL